MPRQPSSLSPGEQPKALIQPLGDLMRRKHFHPSGSQLDRERNPVKPTTNLGNHRCAVVGQCKACIDRKRTIDEERDRCIRQYVSRASVRFRWNRKRWESVGPLTRYVQCFSASRQDAYIWARPHNTRRNLASGLHHVLAVVQNKQEPAGLEVRDDCV